MINKDQVFASAGTTTGSDAAGYTTGMVPQTVAKAEDVNLYMGMSDQQLKVVCDELVNLLAAYGISPNVNDRQQLKGLFTNNFESNFALTGIDRDSYTTAPTQNGNTITFSTLKVVYNTGVYYGNTAAEHQVTTLTGTTLSATSAWDDGVHYIYAKTTTGSQVSTLDHQMTPVSGSEAATKCMLGSVFVINGQFQADSWQFQPWLQITSAETRENPTAFTKGGFVSPASAITLQMGALDILDEGLNFGVSVTSPNIKHIAAVSPFTYKYLHPNYDPSSAAMSTIDTTHIYNIDAGTMDDISSLASTPHYIVIVPCIAPTGQTLMIPAMSHISGQTYTQVFDTMDAAINNVFGLEYDLTNSQDHNVAQRVIFFGQSIIVKVGATDLNDPLQCTSVGMIPQALTGFSSASGQAGGSIATYRPMPSITWSGYNSVTCQNNAANVIVDDGSTISVSMPTPVNSIVNQLEVHYTCNGGSLSWTDTIHWWTGVAPVFTTGSTYNVILEYINGAWYGGLLGIGV